MTSWSGFPPRRKTALAFVLAALLALVVPVLFIWIARAKLPDLVPKPDGYDEMKEYFVKIGSAGDLPLASRRWWEHLLGIRKWV